MLKTSREREREKAPSKRPDDPSRYDSYRKKEEEGGEEEGKKEDRVVYNKNIKTRPGFLLSSYFFHSPFLGTKRILESSVGNEKCWTSTLRLALIIASSLWKVKVIVNISEVLEVKLLKHVALFASPNIIRDGGSSLFPIHVGAVPQDHRTFGTLFCGTTINTSALCCILTSLDVFAAVIRLKTVVLQISRSHCHSIPIWVMNLTTSTSI